MKSFFSAVTMLGAIALGISANATVLPYGFSSEADPAKWYGNGKAETYDIAMAVTVPELAGKKVTGLQVAVPAGITADGASGWLTSQLKLRAEGDLKVPVVDIATATATVDNGILSVTFAEPYVITGDKFYAGYTFNVASPVDDDTKYPVSVVTSDRAESLWMHSTRTQRNWVNKSGVKLGSAMELLIEGDFPAYCLNVASGSEAYISAADGGKMTVNLVNTGMEAATSIGYAYTYKDLTYFGELDLPVTIPAQLGPSFSVDLPIAPGLDPGADTSMVSVVSVNGQPNGSDLTASVPMSVMGFVPKATPLTEEYTGLWCGWCPRGYVALEIMKETYGDRFVALAYHNNDPMEIMSAGQFPSLLANGFPAATINREYGIDPYYGLSNTGFGTEVLWNELASQFAFAQVDATAEWSDAAESALRAQVKVKFAVNPSSTYRLDFALVADGLQSSSWSQSNYYTGMAAPDSNPIWNIFTKGGKTVDGLPFNDVVICYRGGANGVALDVTEPNVEVTVPFTFDLADAVSTAGKSLVQDKGKLRIVAILVDAASGSFINCASTPYTASSAIDNIDADASTAVATEWYDLSGKRIAQPATGLYLRSTRTADGKIATEKVVVK